MRTHPFAVSLGMVGPAAIAAIAVHSWTDFNLHIPANVMMLAAVAAISFCALRQERRGRAYRTRYRYVSLSLKGGGGLAAATAATLLLWAAGVTLAHYRAESYCASDFRPASFTNPRQSVESIQSAIQWNPANASYWYRLAMGLSENRRRLAAPAENNTGADGSAGADSVPHREQMGVVRALAAAIERNPLAADYHYRLGYAYVLLWHMPDASLRWVPAADLCMERAAYFAGEFDNPLLHLQLGDYWLMRSRTVYRSQPEWHVFWQKAVWHYRKNLSLERPRFLKRRMQHIENSLRVHAVDDHLIRDILNPDKPD
jgi:hypothetical protein